MPYLKLLIVLLITFVCVNSSVKDDDIYIDDLVLTECDGVNTDPILVDNVKLHIGKNKEIFASGRMSTSEDLLSPLTAEVTVKKHTFIGWIPIPCTENVGSCGYDDLCTFGIPPKKDCPEKLKENDVPCRCPIAKGNYTIPQISLLNISNEKSVISGKYKGNIMLTHKNNKLACYNMNFTVRDSSKLKNRAKV